MRLYFALFLADSSPGKIQKESLPDQSIMELLISGINKNHNVISPIVDQSLPEIDTWKGVYADVTGDVTEIHRGRRELVGTIPLEWIPLQVILMYINSNKLHGTVCLIELPDRFERLSLSCNRFHESIDLTRLPPRLTRLNLNGNDFRGETVFSQLPPTMSSVNVSETSLSGVIRVYKGRFLGLRGSSVQDVRSNTISD